MNLRQAGAQIYVPDGLDPAGALGRTTHLAVGAHQDDIAIMALHGILECFGVADRWFLAATVADGAGSPRSGPYAEYTNQQMREVRNLEEKKAAFVGEYGAAVLLDYPSPAVKDPGQDAIVDELFELISLAQPQVVYTHNLADKHDTHVSVALRTVAALRRLPADERPQAVYGCEVWRDLDWMNDADKVAFDVSEHQNLAAALVGVYESQIAGGKRYDLASAGRRLANATFSESHAVDTAQALIYAMDLLPLVNAEETDAAAFVAEHLTRAGDDISERITRLSGGEG